MTAWAGQVEDYLCLRRVLGHELAEAARLLPRFVAYLDEIGAEVITVEAALAWAQQPPAGPGSVMPARRMAVVRGFARHMAGVDPRTQIPATGLVPCRQRWRPPFIYSDADVQALIAAVPRVVRSPLRIVTYQTLTGLLAATGMRVGEALRLERGHLDWAEGMLTVHASKFGKSREVPLAASTRQALAAYARTRDKHLPRPKTGAFFVSTTGTPVRYQRFGEAFRGFVQASGVGAGSPVHPRIHDLRHSFAVHTLAGWYQANQDVSALLPRLATYLGHCDPASTYWYLSAAPELLALAAARLQQAQEALP